MSKFQIPITVFSALAECDKTCLLIAVEVLPKAYFYVGLLKIIIHFAVSA
jgi:hypothetical protein